MKLLNYSLVDINKEDLDTKVVGGVKLKLIKEGSEYQKTTQKGTMFHPQEGIGISKGELVWFMHQAVDFKTDYFGDLKYAISKDLIIGVERDGVIAPTGRIIAKKTMRPQKKSGVILIEDKPQMLQNLFEVESAPKESEFKSGDYIIPRKNASYYIEECDRFFIQEDTVIAKVKVELENSLVVNQEIEQLYNGHHIVKKQAVEGEYEDIRGIYLQKTHLYQPQWCFIVNSVKFNKGDRVFCVKSMGGDIEMNNEQVIAVNNEQLYFAE